MRRVLGVVLVAVGVLTGCGGGAVEDGHLEELQGTTVSSEGAASEGTAEAMAAPLPPPYCDTYAGKACSRSGERVDCMWDWTDWSSCYCNGSSWQCT